MSLSYPLSMPSGLGTRGITLRPASAVGAVTSPFTRVPQVQVWAGQCWEADFQLPPMARANAEEWVAMLTGLNFMEGSFLCGDTANKVPRGSAAVPPVTIIDNSTLNGGFETAGGGGADVFANWAETVIFGTLTRDTVVFDSGAASCKYVGGGGVVFLVSSATLVLGRGYSYSIRAKLSAGTLGSSDGVNLSSGNSVGFIRPTASWATYAGTFTAGSTGFTINIPLQTGATINIDQVTVTDLETPPLVNGGSQTGYDLATDGWTAYAPGVLKKGDWIQLGSGATSRIYKVMLDADANGSGQATLTLWPRLRSSPADNAQITLRNTKGVFMLAAPVDYSIDHMHIYGLSFRAMEDLR